MKSNTLVGFIWGAGLSLGWIEMVKVYHIIGGWTGETEPIGWAFLAVIGTVGLAMLSVFTIFYFADFLIAHYG